MKRAEQETYRQPLLDWGQRLQRERTGLSHDALRTTGGDASGSLSNLPLHPADLGSDSFEEEVTLGLLENEDQLLEEIAAALRRLDQGAFGSCEECGAEISKQRLQALPYTRRCIRCARRVEGEAAGGPAPR